MADGQSITEPLLNVGRSSSFETNEDKLKKDASSIFNMDVNYANENKWFGTF